MSDFAAIISLSSRPNWSWPHHLDDSADDGCFVAGTQILLANGNEKPIEKLSPSTPINPEAGDKLLSIDGTIAYVIALFGGNKPKDAHLSLWPLLTICAKGFKDNSTHEVTVTRSHLFSKSDGNLIKADGLCVGDYVRSIHGVSCITEVKPIANQKQQPVWNLYAGSREFVTTVLPLFIDCPDRIYELLASGMWGSRLGLPLRDHMVFSNGFLTGDFTLQLLIEATSSLGSSID